MRSAERIGKEVVRAVRHAGLGSEVLSHRSCGEHGGLQPLPRAGKAACADALSLPRRVDADSKGGHQALAARLWSLAAWRITGTERDARNRSARFPAGLRSR